MEYLCLLVIIYMVLMLASSQIPPGPPVIARPQFQVLNSQITLTCTSARGNPTPTVKWFFDRTEITTGISTTTAGTAVTASLTFTATKNYHLEVLECQVENGVLQNPLSTTKYIEVQFSPESPTLTGPPTLTPGQQGIWTCISANGYPAGVMTMKNQNNNTQFTTEFTSSSVLDQKSFDVTGTLTWSPVIVNNGDTICCDVTHTTTLGSTPQTVCRQITVAQPILINAPVTQYSPNIQSSVTLQCDVTQGTASQIIWIKENFQLNTTSNSRFSGGTVVNESLTLANVQQSDGGNYVCRGIDAVTGNIVNTNTISVNVIPVDEDEDNIIIYVVIGILAVLVLSVLLVVMIRYRRGREKKKDNTKSKHVSKQTDMSNRQDNADYSTHRDRDRDYEGLDSNRREMHIYNTPQDHLEYSHYSTIPANHVFVDPNHTENTYLEPNHSNLKEDHTYLKIDNTYIEPVNSILTPDDAYLEPGQINIEPINGTSMTSST
ncbi:titin homolog isoform X2 [Mytilus trossulus]|uniref:titin homolog isoform X2 n=1 Tax=Mytilus trossulus TaxID=6551 RepID=UPI00300695B4